jgi:hypothetical protein
MLWFSRQRLLRRCDQATNGFRAESFSGGPLLTDIVEKLEKMAPVKIDVKVVSVEPRC